MKEINILNLGCPKNIADAESFSYPISKIYKINYSNTLTKCDILIINSCGFINSACQETIDVITKAIELKKKKKIKKIIVYGCLVNRFKDLLIKNYNEIDYIFKTTELNKLYSLLNITQINEEKRLIDPHFYYSYLKIADGCNRKCSFCVIPFIKGKYKSKPITKIINEAKYLKDNNIKELILVAQDTTYYGFDIYKKFKLPELLYKLSKLNFEWIRILYLYPKNISNELLNIIKNTPSICKYIDLPIQHISDKILKLMRRNITENQLKELLYKIREKIPNVAIRTTIIVGHPYETDKDFNKLINFIKEFEFDKLGVFKYSHEVGSYAFYNYADNVNEKIKEERYNIIMSIQKDISSKKLKKFIGTNQQVLIEKKIDNFTYIGRTQFDAPEIDGFTYVKSNIPLKLGEFTNVSIIQSYEYDLYGIPINK